MRHGVLTSMEKVGGSQNPWIGWLVKVFLFWSQSVKAGEGEYFFKCKESNIWLQYEKRGNMTLLKEHNKFSVTEPKEMEIYELFDKNLKSLS
jgi:hypothetical protein